MTEGSDETLTQLAQRFKAELENNPSGGEVLDTLGDIERKIVIELRGETADQVGQVIRSEGETRMISRALEKIGIGSSVNTILDEIDRRAVKAIEGDSSESAETMDEMNQRLGINVTQYSVTIVKTQKDTRPRISVGGSLKRERKELEETSKYKQLLIFLRSLGVYKDDLSVGKETITDEMMREQEYYYIEIPKINRSILLNPAYAEATYVFPTIYPRYRVFEHDKNEYETKFGAIMVPYYEDNIGLWQQKMQAALRLDSEAESSEVDMESYNERQFFIDELMKRYLTPEEFMAVGHRDKKKIEINGKHLGGIASSITKKKGLRPVVNSHDMALIGREIYGEGHEVIDKYFREIESDSWTKEQWEAAYFEQCPTLIAFLSLNNGERRGLQFGSEGGEKRLTAVSHILTGDMKLNPVTTKADRVKFAKQVYGASDEDLEEALQEVERLIREKQKAASASKAKPNKAERVSGKDRPVDPEKKAEMIEKIKAKYATPEDWMNNRMVSIGKKKLTAIAGVVLGGTHFQRNRKLLAKVGQEAYGKGHLIIDRELWTKKEWIEKVKEKYPTESRFREESSTAGKRYKVTVADVALTGLFYIFEGRQGAPVTSPQDFETLVSAIYK